ncbi:hypothetical protein L6E12_06350 [Actinokineospora sp. PR83]|uniref:sunset domain-containing protein n=1 Tax=Actinokineospora sp. PR83 TaxID=2884908 RepID=UPI001F46569B|nr:hypothetical protein [Actinokineospora sp. PR83]MCG8915406.1 hypothetical protein [Actinokineospora sp. PR83]
MGNRFTRVNPMARPGRETSAMPFFGQVWVWSLAGFLVGALLCWLLIANPARKRVVVLERRLAEDRRVEPVRGTEQLPAPTPERTAVVSGYADEHDEYDRRGDSDVRTLHDAPAHGADRDPDDRHPDDRHDGYGGAADPDRADDDHGDDLRDHHGDDLRDHRDDDLRGDRGDDFHDDHAPGDLFVPTEAAAETTRYIPPAPGDHDDRDTDSGATRGDLAHFGDLGDLAAHARGDDFADDRDGWYAGRDTDGEHLVDDLPGRSRDLDAERADDDRIDLVDDGEDHGTIFTQHTERIPAALIRSLDDSTPDPDAVPRHGTDQDDPDHRADQDTADRDHPGDPDRDHGDHHVEHEQADLDHGDRVEHGDQAEHDRVAPVHADDLDGHRADQDDRADQPHADQVPHAGQDHRGTRGRRARRDEHDEHDAVLADDDALVDDLADDVDQDLDEVLPAESRPRHAPGSLSGALPELTPFGRPVEEPAAETSVVPRIADERPAEPEPAAAETSFVPRVTDEPRSRPEPEPTPEPAAQEPEVPAGITPAYTPAGPQRPGDPLPKRVPSRPRTRVPFGGTGAAGAPAPLPERQKVPAAAMGTPIPFGVETTSNGGRERSLFEPIVPVDEAPAAKAEAAPAHAQQRRRGARTLQQTAGGVDPFVPPGPFGPGSAMPLPGGRPPSGEYTIKASVTALRYCSPESPKFDRTVAEVWFRSVDDAERVGFRPLP